jgi:DNA/RNA endonuclease G (NUC1)
MINIIKIFILSLFFKQSTSNFILNNKYLKNNNEKIINYNYYTVSFNDSINSINYGIYKLGYNKSLCQSRYIHNKIHYDIHIYDNGHMVPKADIIDCSTNVRENIVTQYSNFNRGIWKELEAYIRKYYINHIILTAPEYDLNNYIIIEDNIIYIPTGFYKIIFNTNYDIVSSIYLKHTNENQKLDINIFTNNNKLPYFIK